jgi:hypothetical protein
MSINFNGVQDLFLDASSTNILNNNIISTIGLKSTYEYNLIFTDTTSPFVINTSVINSYFQVNIMAPSLNYEMTIPDGTIDGQIKNISVINIENGVPENITLLSSSNFPNQIVFNFDSSGNKIPSTVSLAWVIDPLINTGTWIVISGNLITIS